MDVNETGSHHSFGQFVVILRALEFERRHNKGNKYVDIQFW